MEKSYDNLSLESIIIDTPQRIMKKIGNSLFIFGGSIFIIVSILLIFFTFKMVDIEDLLIDVVDFYSLMISFAAMFLLFGLNLLYNGLHYPNFKLIKWERIEFNQDYFTIYTKEPQNVLKIFPNEIRNFYFLPSIMRLRVGVSLHSPGGRGRLVSQQFVIVIMWEDQKGKNWRLNPFYYEDDNEALQLENSIMNLCKNSYNISPKKKVKIEIYLTIFAILAFLAVIISFIVLSTKY